MAPPFWIRTSRRLLPGLLFAVVGCRQDEAADAEPVAAEENVAPSTKGDERRADGDGAAAEPADAPADPGSTPQPPMELTDDVGALVAALGDRAVLTFVVRPSKWVEAQPALAALAGAMPDPALAGVARTEAPADAALAVGKAIVGKDLGGLKGYDLTKPIVGAVAEVASGPTDPEVGAKVDPSRATGLRHVVLVPVSDGEAFVTSLADALGYETLPNWIGGEGPAWTARVPSFGYVVVGIEGSYARITVLSEAGDVPRDRAEALLLPRIRPAASAPPKTPALRELVDGGALVAVNLRPWRVGDTAAYFGRYQLAKALSHVPEDMRALALARGLAEIVNLELLITSATAELDDWTYMLRTRETQVSVAAVASLTPHGRKVWDAGKTEIVPLPVKAKGPVVEGFARLHLAAMLDAVEPHPGLAHAETAEMAERFAECGWACYLHALQGAPIQSAATLLAAEPIPGGGLPPAVSLQGALTSVDPPKAAVAAVFASPADAHGARTWLERAAGAKVSKHATIAEAHRGDEGVVLGSIGTKAKSAFEIGGRTTNALLFVDGHAKGSFVPATLAGLRGRVQLDRRGPALVLQVGVAKETVPALDYAPEFSGMSWASPIPPFEGADDADCLRRAALGVGAMFTAMAKVAPDQRAKVIREGEAELAEHFACADGSEGARIRAKRLEGTVNTVLTALVKKEE